VLKRGRNKSQNKLLRRKKKKRLASKNLLPSSISFASQIKATTRNKKGVIWTSLKKRNGGKDGGRVL
jgi:hypothetical protein